MWFRRSPRPGSALPADVAQGLRQQALAVGPADLGVDAATVRRVWGVLMETGYREAVATLVVLADGSTSLYFSNGGGIIGAGAHAPVRAAGETLLSTAESFVGQFAPVAATPQPAVGRVRFYLRMAAGTLSAEAREAELGEGRHALSPLFLAAHAVITAIRESTPMPPASPPPA